MATVPGPRPDRPLPTPGVTEEPEREYEDERQASPAEPTPSWEPQPYDPEREHVEPAAPVGVP